MEKDERFRAISEFSFSRNLGIQFLLTSSWPANNCTATIEAVSEADGDCYYAPISAMLGVKLCQCNDRESFNLLDDDE